MPLSNEELRATLREIEVRRGSLTPEIVVEEARSKSHPLHDAFTWNDKRAAAQWRLEEARALIRRVQVVITVEERVIRAPAYVHDPRAAPDEQRYVSTLALRKDGDHSREVVMAEFKAAHNHLRRARDLAAYLDQQDLVDDLIRRLDESMEAISRHAPGSA